MFSLVLFDLAVFVGLVCRQSNKSVYEQCKQDEATTIRCLVGLFELVFEIRWEYQLKETFCHRCPIK